MEQQGDMPEQGAPSAVTAASGAASHSQSDGPGNGSFGGQVSPVSSPFLNRNTAAGHTAQGHCRQHQLLPACQDTHWSPEGLWG